VVRLRLATLVAGLSVGLMALVPAQCAFGQGLNYGTFTGTVTDPSGAAIPDATVHLIRSDTNTVRDTMTESNGGYRLLDVSPGTYRLEIEHAGFRKEIRTDIPISAGQSLRVDASLTLGTVSDAVQVTTKVAEVDTATANVGSTVFGSQVRELALNTRSFTQLMTLQPGVASSQAQQPGFGSNTTVPFSFNGAQQSSNNWLVDGGRNIDTYNGNNMTMFGGCPLAPGRSHQASDRRMGGLPNLFPCVHQPRRHCRGPHRAQRVPVRIRKERRGAGECHHQVGNGCIPRQPL
jgi:hypothetical protein